jgi:Zn ribbon nucleic-acid-binding protein
MTTTSCGCPIVDLVECAECGFEDVPRTRCAHEAGDPVCPTCQRADSEWTPPA